MTDEFLTVEEPCLKIKTKVSTLIALLKVMTILVDEVKVVADNDSISIKMVDPAHVAMCTIEMKQKGEIEFTHNENGSWGLDVELLKNYLIIPEIDKESPCELRLFEKNTFLTIGQTQMKMDAPDTVGMTEPKVPTLTLPNSFTLPFPELQKAILMNGYISDHIKITSDSDGVEFSALADTLGYKHTIPAKDLPQLEAKEICYSLFPEDYLKNMLAGFKDICGQGPITLNMGNEYPVAMTWTGLLPGNEDSSSIKLYFILAPRIETE